MRDLDFWRRLSTGAVTPEELVVVADWPLTRRAAFLHGLLALLAHEDPARRAAAVGALAGVRGVPGVRAIVERLADDDDAARDAAVSALRVTARDAPVRYAHALFHDRVAVRRTALFDVPHGALEAAAYLRADPETADLAKLLPWPSSPLPLAFDLHATGVLSAGELIVVVGRVPTDELHTFLVAEHGRLDEELDAYLEAITLAPTLAVAAGTDVLDLLVHAIDEADASGAVMHLLVSIATVKKRGLLLRRVLVALLSRIAHKPSARLWEAACVLDPRLIALPVFDRSFGFAAAAGLLRFGWPVRPARAQVDRLLELRWVSDDLALATAIAGLYTGGRLRRLAKVVGEPLIIDSLLASTHGWNEICRLPIENPPLEGRWLSMIEAVRPARYVELAAIALSWFAGTRLDGFIDQMQRRFRHQVFLSYLDDEQVTPDAPQLVAIARVMAFRLDRAALGELFGALLGVTMGERGPLIARVIARALSDKLLASVGRVLDDAAAARLVVVIDGLEALPRDRELALAKVWLERTHPAVRDWAARVSRIEEARPIVPLPSLRVHHKLDAAHQKKITECDDADLEAMLGKALHAPTANLVPALAARDPHVSVAACAALLGCTDPIDQVAVQLDRFAAWWPRFSDDLDSAATALWRTAADLPPLAHARLWRWEAHTLQLARWIDAAGGTLAALDALDKMPGQLGVDTLWRGIAEVLMFARYRDRPRYLRDGTVELALFVANRVDRPVGRHAARIAVCLIEGGAVPLHIIKKSILDRTADADAPTRELLARLIRLEGMPTPPRGDHGPPAGELITQIKASRDLDALEVWCMDPRAAVVQEAVLVMLTLGEAGQLRLASLLSRLVELTAPVPLLASIALWDAPAALEVARSLATRAELLPEWQFHLCLGLGDITGAIAAARVPTLDGWFRRADWEALSAITAPLACAFELADASHHHAYAPSIALLLEQPDTPEIHAALRRFLEISALRPLHLRRSVARRLALAASDLSGLPILVEEVIDEGAHLWIQHLSRDGTRLLASAIVDGALIGGHTACTEKRMWAVLHVLRDYGSLDAEHLNTLYTRILEEASTAPIRRAVAQLAVGEMMWHARLLQIAEVFAWGVKRGVELTGRLMRFHMTGEERDLGHTFLSGSKVFVSPLPMLRGEANGRDIVEGLVLHELGHHVYHRGEEAQQLWKQAHKEGLGHLLNLVADEHLERNLRGTDRSYGDRLKRLDAYAFQHAPQEIDLGVLLMSLRGSTATALIRSELEVAFAEGSLRMRRGSILTELERAGHPLARFARALRMGLGNRFADPRVAAALEMCGKDLRKLDMRGLYELTKRLAAMFGGATSIARVFGGPEGLEFGERDQDVFGGGIDDDILQREVERILDPRRGKRGGPIGPRDRLQINVSPDEAFDRITNVTRVRGSPEEHRKLAGEVNRHSVRLRAHLDDLGLRWVPAKARIKGHALDRSRLKALVTRGDPRILVARTPVRRTDLFLGTVIDCSGSMQIGQNIDRARQFAVLIAEAVRPLPGVEARFFGFTESEIFDAGDAQDCNVTALHAGGGNNDAAALLHAANVATASRKRARVLVMISDGLPTDCSVSALRGLVTTLTKRKGIVCAQVAVRRLEEECFPHYVVLDDADLGVAVAKFGRMIGDLARKVLASS